MAELAYEQAADEALFSFGRFAVELSQKLRTLPTRAGSANTSSRSSCTLVSASSWQPISHRIITEALDGEL